jgi:hypothetical protein
MSLIEAPAFSRMAATFRHTCRASSAKAAWLGGDQWASGVADGEAGEAVEQRGLQLQDLQQRLTSLPAQVSKLMRLWWTPQARTQP